MTQTPTPPKVTSESEFKRFALLLKNANPQAFDGFVAVLDVYAGEVMHQMAQAPQEQILNMQGRANQCLAFLRMLRECHIPKAQPQTQPPQ